MRTRLPIVFSLPALLALSLLCERREARGQAPPTGAARDRFAYTVYLGGPAADRDYNPTGAATTVSTSAEGVYRVRFPGIGAPGGNVQVAAFGKTPGKCQADSWGPTADGAEEVVVRCFNIDPPVHPQNTGFTVIYNNKGETTVVNRNGYAWVGYPRSAASPMPPMYRYVPATEASSLDYRRSGPYTYYLGSSPLNATPPTAVFVTPTGPIRGSCSAKAGEYGSGLLACMGAGGAEVPFSVFRVREAALSIERREGGFARTNAIGGLVPGPYSWSSRGGLVSTARLPPRPGIIESYRVRFPLIGGPGGTALVNSGSSCRALSAEPDGADEVVTVECSTSSSESLVAFVR